MRVGGTGQDLEKFHELVDSWQAAGLLDSPTYQNDFKCSGSPHSHVANFSFSRERFLSAPNMQNVKFTCDWALENAQLYKNAVPEHAEYGLTFFEPAYFKFFLRWI